MMGGVQNEFFLGRQPIVGRSRELFAYELLFRSSRTNAATVVDDAHATANVIKHAFSDLGIDSALGDRKGFINFDEQLLMTDMVETLPQDRVVLELLEHVPMTPTVVDRCQQLQRAGYSLGLDDVVELTDGLKAVMPYVAFVKIDVLVLSEMEITALVRELHAHDVKLLAEKIETLERYEFCKQVGFDFFQGYYFAKPTVPHPAARSSRRRGCCSRFFVSSMGNAKRPSWRTPCGRRPISRCGSCGSRIPSPFSQATKSTVSGTPSMSSDAGRSAGS